MLLFRAVSLLCCGNENLHVELRARVVCELALNKDFYLTADKVSLYDNSSGDGTCILISKNILPATSGISTCNSSNAHEYAEECLQLVTLNTPCLGTSSNMWHLYAMSSILQTPIVSIYPMYNTRIRPAFNKVVRPRVECKSKCNIELFIMWTRMAEPTVGPAISSSWSPDHFVPCIKDACDNQSMQLPEISQIYKCANSTSNTSQVASASNCIPSLNRSRKTSLPKMDIDIVFKHHPQTRCKNTSKSNAYPRPLDKYIQAQPKGELNIECGKVFKEHKTVSTNMTMPKLPNILNVFKCTQNKLTNIKKKSDPPKNITKGHLFQSSTSSYKATHDVDTAINSSGIPTGGDVYTHICSGQDCTVMPQSDVGHSVDMPSQIYVLGSSCEDGTIPQIGSVDINRPLIIGDSYQEELPVVTQPQVANLNVDATLQGPVSSTTGCQDDVDVPTFIPLDIDVDADVVTIGIHYVYHLCTVAIAFSRFI